MQILFLIAIVIMLFIDGYAVESKPNLTTPTKETLNPVSNAINNPAAETKGDEYVVIADITEIRRALADKTATLVASLKKGTRVRLMYLNGEEDVDKSNVMWLEVVGREGKCWIKADDVIPAIIYDALVKAEELAKAGDHISMRETLDSVQGNGIAKTLSISPNGAKVIVEFRWFENAPWRGELEYDKDVLFISSKGLMTDKIDFKYWDGCAWSVDSLYYAAYEPCFSGGPISGLVLLNTDSLKRIDLGICLEKIDDMPAAFEFVEGYFLWVALVKPPVNNIPKSYDFTPMLMAINLNNLQKSNILLPDYKTVQEHAGRISFVAVEKIPEAIKNARLFKYYSENTAPLIDSNA